MGEKIGEKNVLELEIMKCSYFLPVMVRRYWEIEFFIINNF